MMESPLLKRKRGKNFTPQEEDALVELVDEQRHILENKRYDAVTWNQKEEAWKKLAECFTARIGTNREWRTLWDKFESLKRKSKAEMATEKSERYRTGGGSAAVESSSMVTQKVAAISGESATGLENTSDGDAIDTSTPEREKFIVHTEDITDADELNQENVKNVDHEEEQWSSWTPNARRSKKSSKLLIDRPGTRKRNLEEEKIKLTVYNNNFMQMKIPGLRKNMSKN
ncbi:uncharacterized protein LOC126767553 [Bactrocera neohumeralis]|uniref:uncharacterized protein LOC126767553 n=1 Tax=Bactrocera neohumeralis TaxID=98809 RepID=UPI002165B056|nr:uncharacterized protein LOC126767553 [Bactrocera neohumeralis]